MNLLPGEQITMPGTLHLKTSLWPLTCSVDVIRRVDNRCLVRLTHSSALGPKGMELWVPNRAVRDPTWRENYLAATQKENT